MFSKEEVEVAKKLLLSIHNHRYDFLYKVSLDSSRWNNGGWKTVVDGYNSRTGQRIIPKLTDKAILDVINGNKTTIQTGNKKVFDVEYLASRFGKYTRYFVIDIDNKSNNDYFCIEAVHKILEITRNIGNPIFLRSSYSEGWHLRWYFSEPIQTFPLASYLKDLFENNGFVLKAGKLEIFPNRKANPETFYNAIRLPCQKGQALLSIEDAHVLAEWSEEPEMFLCHWANEVSKNLLDSNRISILLENPYKNSKSKKWLEDFLSLKDKGLTSKSQTNWALGQMAKGFIVHEGITDVREIIQKLCHWIENKHNGLSEEYNTASSIVFYHCERWAKCALKRYKPLNKLINKPVKNNTKRALSAQYEHRLEKAFKDGLINYEMSIRAIQNITGIPKSVVQRKLSE